MDNDSYRHAPGQINRLPCVFARALAVRQAVCELALAGQVGGQPAMVCAQPLARAACAQLASLLKEKSAFALKEGRAAAGATSPGGRGLRLECGGLAGLRDVLDALAPAPDVHRLVRLAQERYGDLAELPYSEIVKGIAAWRGDLTRLR